MRDFNQEGAVQPEQALKGTQVAQTALKIPSGGSDKFSASSKAKGAARRDFARRRNKGKPSRSIFAQSFFPQRQYGSRPAAANRLAQQFQFQSGPAKGGQWTFRSIFCLTDSEPIQSMVRRWAKINNSCIRST